MVALSIASFAMGEKRMQQRNSGVTIIELLVAMSVSAIVITLSFTVFSDLLKGFMFQKSRAQTSGDMIVAKKQIDGCLAGIISIKEYSDKAIACMKADVDTFVAIRFVKDSLCIENKAVCRKLKDFTFTLIKKDAGPWTLLWNAHLKHGDWFGGAVSGRR
jgi:prepilin-type N-terminal cleavage/methylation domain-containing protein